MTITELDIPATRGIVVQPKGDDLCHWLGVLCGDELPDALGGGE